LKDPGHVCERFEARRSPEAFVLDRGRRVAYRGRIDDQYAVGSQKPRATKTELIDALEAVLAGRSAAVPVTEAPGAPLRGGRSGRPDVGGSYSRDVAPIIQNRCQACHRPGQSGPFAFMNYRQVSKRAKAIREAVESRRMPPWGADPKHGKFANDPSLSESE